MEEKMKTYKFNRIEFLAVKGLTLLIQPLIWTINCYEGYQKTRFYKFFTEKVIEIDETGRRIK
jgi:hypothetical protein